jgi:outer membrane protein OmpA-like peptidoglycan-associated protein
MQLKRILPLVLPLIIGCGGSIVLRSPIQDQCDKNGIQGCPDIVDGALLYIDGNKIDGKAKMCTGASANAPEKLKIYSDAIRVLPLDKIPGAGAKYGKIILEVADAIAGCVGTPVVVATPVAPPPGPPAKIVVQGLNLQGAQLAGIPDIEFDTGKAEIKPSPKNETTLKLLLLGGQTNKNITLLRVEGHTDSDGDPGANQTLSERRAQAVVGWLVAHGIDAGRLRAVGCAARDPLVPNDSAEHKARNRRTEFDIETIDGQRPDGYTDACAPNPSRH